jgi:inner membrane protein
LLAAKLLEWYLSVPQLLFVAVLTLLPDIDHPSSPIGKLLKPLSLRIYSTLGHRKATHSLLFSLLITNFFAVNLTLYKLSWIALGAHLFCDMLTYMGTPLLWPLQKNFVAFGGPLLTGSWKELFVSLLALAGVIFLCI